MDLLELRAYVEGRMTAPSERDDRRRFLDLLYAG